MKIFTLAVLLALTLTACKPGLKYTIPHQERTPTQTTAANNKATVVANNNTATPDNKATPTANQATVVADNSNATPPKPKGPREIRSPFR